MALATAMLGLLGFGRGMNKRILVNLGFGCGFGLFRKQKLIEIGDSGM